MFCFLSLIKVVFSSAQTALLNSVRFPEDNLLEDSLQGQKDYFAKFWPSCAYIICMFLVWLPCVCSLLTSIRCAHPFPSLLSSLQIRQLQSGATQHSAITDKKRRGCYRTHNSQLGRLTQKESQANNLSSCAKWPPGKTSNFQDMNSKSLLNPMKMNSPDYFTSTNPPNFKVPSTAQAGNNSCGKRGKNSARQFKT